MFKSEAGDGPSFDVLVHGLIGVDYLLWLDRIPLPGEPRVIEREWRGVGGEGINCAVALALWGARVCLTGNPLGTDSNGRLVMRELQALPNLTLQVPLLDNFETPYSVILTAGQAPRAMLLRHQSAIHYDRQNGEYAPAVALSSAESSLDGTKSANTIAWPVARVATCDSRLPLWAHRLAQHLRQRGTPLFAQDDLCDLSVVSQLVGPLAEVVLLTAASGPQHSNEELMRLACERAADWGNVVIIVRGGRSGIWCRAGGAAQRYDVQRYVATGIDIENSIDSAGAVDVFRAGLLWAHLQEWEWERGLRFAAVAAALKSAAGDAGGIEALPRLDEIEDALNP